MDIFEIVTPKKIPNDEISEIFPRFSNFNRLDNNETLIKLKNSIITQRLKLSNFFPTSTDNNNGYNSHSLKNYLMVMETYITNLFEFLKCLNDEESTDFVVQEERKDIEMNLLKLGKNVEFFISPDYLVLWDLPITTNSIKKKNNNINKVFVWSLTDEIQISLISLIILYFKNGLSMIDELQLYDLNNDNMQDIKTMNSEEITKFINDKNGKWALITEKFFKKSVSICKYLKDNMYALDSNKNNNNNLGTYLSMERIIPDSDINHEEEQEESYHIIELSIHFIEFLNSFTMANFQFLAVLLKNFWLERIQFLKMVLLEGNYTNDMESSSESYYRLQDLNDDFYKRSNYNLLIKIGKFVLNELTNDGGILNYLTNFKYLIQKEENDKDKCGTMLGNLQKMIKLIKIYIILIKMYLLKYLSMEYFIKKNQVGFSISLINYGFKLLNEAIIDDESTKLISKLKIGTNDNVGRKKKDGVTLKDKLKSKMKKSDSASKREEYVTTLNDKNDQRFKFESIIKNGYHYRVILNKNHKNLLILSDLNNLIIFMKNFKYKLTLQNDNLSFERITEISDSEFMTKLPLGRQLPVNLPTYDPSKKETDILEKRDDGDNQRPAYY